MKANSEAERQDALYNNLKVIDVANRLGVSDEHVYELIESKELKALDVSKKDAKRKTYRIREEWLVDFERRRDTAA